MGEGAIEEGTEHVISSRSSDLLLRFCGGGFSTDELAETAGGGDSDEIELDLSLGGCFSSVDSRKTRISRSSSIPSILPSELQPAVPLSRASSLPSGTEEEIWRRKELQSMKRMEAKRKMEERRMVGQRFEQDLEEGSVAKLRRFDVENEKSWIMSGDRAKRVSSPAISKWIAGAPVPSICSIPLGSQGSIVSQASSSSGGTEMESRPAGPRQGFELSGFSSDVPLTMAEHKHHKSSSVSPSSSLTPTSNPINGTTSFENPLKKNGGRCNNGRNVEEMPSVSTRGDGPNGRRIEGFLYKYRRGEEVRIVCVCHGSFLTPAEFVKHGGGGDVAHPLKHIVVNPNPAFL